MRIRPILRLLSSLAVVSASVSCTTDREAPTAAVRPAPSVAASRIHGYDIPAYSAVADPQWTALFTRTSGWTGSDGIYSIPLNGVETPGSGATGTTFWLFNDSFVGAVLTNGSRGPGTVLVNNTNALLQGDQPDPARMQFRWGVAAGGAPRAVVIPSGAPGRWLWPNDGVVVGGKIVFFALRETIGSGGAFNFRTEGVSLLADDAANPAPFTTYQQVNTPLYLPAQSPNGDITYGMAVMPNTVAAGAPHPDGWLYVYGVRNDLSKKLLAARVLPKNIARFASYEFWNGSIWLPRIDAAAPLVNRMSSEFSVTPLADGRYLLVFQLDALSRTIAVRYGATPVGPWGAPIKIYDAPETSISPNILIYGAKAHPHLSQPGELLISYHVNTTSFTENLQNADIYHPRFVRVRVQ